VYVLDSPSDGVSKVKFKADAAEDLIEYLQKEHTQAFNDRSGLEQKWKLWLDQANSRRKRKDARPRDSQIDMPLTRRRLIQHSSRLLNPIFQQDQLMVAKSRKNIYHDFAMHLEDVMDYMTDKVDLQSVCEDWVEQFQIFNFGVVKTPFVKEITNVKQWLEIGFDEYVMYEEAGASKLLRKEMDNGTAKYYIEEDRELVTFSGVKPEVIPIEDFICPITTCDVNSADWVSHRIWLTKKSVEARIKAGIYNEKDQKGNKVLDALGHPSASRKKLLDYATTEDRSGGEAEPSSKQYEVFETYLSWDYDKSGTCYEIIVTWDKSSGCILRAVDNFYHGYRRPFVTHSYKKVHGSIFGIPATFMLEPLHVANSASFNQRLDAASKANEKIIGVPPGAAAELKAIHDTEGIRGGVYEIQVSKDEVIDLSLSQPFSQLDSLEAKFEQQADDLMSLSDYSFGREQIQRPTATGQVSIIEESKQPLYGQLERFRKSFAEVVLHMLSRYRQFYPEGLEYYVESQDPQSAGMMEQMFLQWPEEAIEDAVLIETKVTSAQMSKHLRKQEVIALLDRIPQMYQTMMGMAQAASQPGPMSMIAAKLLNGYQQVANQFLTEFEVPKKESLNPNLVQEAQVAQMVAQQIQQLQGQVQSLGQQLQMAQGQPPGIPGGGPPGPGMAQGPQPPPGVQGPPGMGGPPAGPQI
jgi:hypothetical protein